MPLIKTSKLLALLLLLTACEENSEPRTGNAAKPLNMLQDNFQQYSLPSPHNKITFPKAHAPHKSYRHEWWYLTANLISDSGQRFASQWTLFRVAHNQRHWYFAHAALADTKAHLSAFRNGREELGNVAITTRPFTAVIDDWLWQSSADLLPAQLNYGSAIYALNRDEAVSVVLDEDAVQPENWQVNLFLSSTSPFYLQGELGFSKKHQRENIASHYYSLPFIDVAGKIYWQEQWHSVTGYAWFDREWGSSILAQDQQGWDWFSLRLSKDTALMIYRIRSHKNDFLYGSLMQRNGDIEILTMQDIVLKTQTISQGHYPQEFTLQIEKQGVDLRINILNDKQIMRFGIEYFEGMVTFNGSHAGEGFVEMTGYD